MSCCTTGNLERDPTLENYPLEDQSSGIYVSAESAQGRGGLARRTSAPRGVCRAQNLCSRALTTEVDAEAKATASPVMSNAISPDLQVKVAVLLSQAYPTYL